MPDKFLNNSKDDIRLQQIQERFDQLLQIGIALSSETDPNRLLELIVSQTRKFTRADAGSLFILDGDNLHFQVSQNDTLSRRQETKTPFKAHTISLSSKSIAGHCCIAGEILNLKDVYHLPEEVPCEFNPDFDRENDYVTRSMLVVPMKDQDGNTLGVLQLINALDETGNNVAFEESMEPLVVSLASQAAVAIRNTNLIDEIKAQRQEMQEAYLKIEESNQDLDAALKKVQVVRNFATIFTIVLFLGLGLYVWNLGSVSGKAGEQESYTAPTGDISAETFTVQPAPMRSTITLTGFFEPLSLVNVTSPFFGKVKEVHFNYGQQVENGQILLEMDSYEVGVKCRDAEALSIKARERLDDVVAWEDSPDVSRAKRALTKAKISLESYKEKTNETKQLFEKGIIAGSEYEAAKEQYTNMQFDYKSAQEELKAVLARGNPANIKIAKLEVENARRKMELLQGQLNNALIFAPVSGVVISPALSIGKSLGRTVARGIGFDQGEVLLSIGNMEGISVKCNVNEVDINKVTLGQAVTVSIEAFPDITLYGTISHISYQAVKAKGRAPFFEIKVTVDRLPEEYRSRILLGMTALLEVVTYNNPEALVVPAAALFSQGFEWYVTVRDTDTQKFKIVKVEPGISSYESVEITSGLQVGDQVLLAGGR